jgi:acetyl esterase/lipase
VARGPSGACQHGRIRLGPAPLATIIVAVLAAAPAPASADTRVLEHDPYYLSLHEAEPPARGTVLLLHGGGWHGDLGAAADELMSATIEALTGWGYDVANLGYRGGEDSLRDAGAAFESLRARTGAEEPLCIYGTSAGGQLALLVAAREGADVDCVVDLLGPPDLEDFGARPRSSAGERLAREAFGPGRLAALSPINNTSRTHAPVLVGATPCDVFTPIAAQRRLASGLRAANPDSQLVVIAPGNDVDLEHCDVDGESFQRFQATTRSFLNSVAPAPRVADPAPASDDSGFPWLAVLGALAAAIAAVVLIGAFRR